MQDVGDMEEQDLNRLPTVSASQALQDIDSTSRRPIGTGLRRLDRVLQGKSYEQIDEDGTTGGLPRGQITEIYGPPGAGKSILA
ncbi:MAG: hypothetical protein Q9218_005277 [Villophora microphyllina]